MSRLNNPMYVSTLATKLVQKDDGTYTATFHSCFFILVKNVLTLLAKSK